MTNNELDLIQDRPPPAYNGGKQQQTLHISLSLALCLFLLSQHQCRYFSVGCYQLLGEIDIVDVGKRKRLRNAALTSEAQKCPDPSGPAEAVMKRRRFLITVARLFL